MFAENCIKNERSLTEEIGRVLPPQIHEYFDLQNVSYYMLFKSDSFVKYSSIFISGKNADLAEGKSAYIPPSTPLPAANDGNYGSCSHKNPPWLVVDLETEHEISQVVISAHGCPGNQLFLNNIIQYKLNQVHRFTCDLLLSPWVRFPRGYQRGWYIAYELINLIQVQKIISSIFSFSSF